MRNKILFLLLAIFSLNSFSQSYHFTDSKVKNYSNISTVETLSNKIKNDFTTDGEKVRALFIWIVENVKYHINRKSWSGTSLEFYYSDYQKKRETRLKEIAILKKAMKSKKANCYGYSLIFKEVCDLLNIESFIILGYSRGSIGDIGKENIIKNHTWNAVKVNNKWKLIDIAWANGYRLIEKADTDKYYYITKPDEFINQHLPADPKWQLLPNKISKKEFVSTPILYPKYYNTEYKLKNEKAGIIKVSKEDKFVSIHFDQIAKKNKIRYSFFKDLYSKSTFFKRNEDGTYRLKIKFNKKRDSYLTIYSDMVPLIGLKIEPTN